MEEKNLDAEPDTMDGWSDARLCGVDFLKCLEVCSIVNIRVHDKITHTQECKEQHSFTGARHAALSATNLSLRLLDVVSHSCTREA